jgi:hypothetical protein
MVYPDVLFGIYTPDEASFVERGAEPAFVESAPAPAPVAVVVPKQDRIAKVLAGLERYQITEQMAMACTDGSYDQLVELGKAIKGGTITLAEIAAKAMPKAEVEDFDPEKLT